MNDTRLMAVGALVKARRWSIHRLAVKEPALKQEQEKQGGGEDGGPVAEDGAGGEGGQGGGGGFCGARGDTGLGGGGEGADAGAVVAVFPGAEAGDGGDAALEHFGGFDEAGAVPFSPAQQAFFFEEIAGVAGLDFGEGGGLLGAPVQGVPQHEREGGQEGELLAARGGKGADDEALALHFSGGEHGFVAGHPERLQRAAGAEHAGLGDGEAAAGDAEKHGVLRRGGAHAFMRQARAGEAAHLHGAGGFGRIQHDGGAVGRPGIGQPLLEDIDIRLVTHGPGGGCAAQHFDAAGLDHGGEGEFGERVGVFRHPGDDERARARQHGGGGIVPAEAVAGCLELDGHALAFDAFERQDEGGAFTGLEFQLTQLGEASG